MLVWIFGICLYFTLVCVFCEFVLFDVGLFGLFGSLWFCDFAVFIGFALLFWIANVGFRVDLNCVCVMLCVTCFAFCVCCAVYLLILVCFVCWLFVVFVFPCVCFSLMFGCYMWFCGFACFAVGGLTFALC